MTLSHVPSTVPTFNCSRGPAFLLRSAINVSEQAVEHKMLLTGKHAIASIKCAACQTEIGWKYYTTPTTAQRYKENKYILEKDKIYKDNKWSLKES